MRERHGQNVDLWQLQLTECREPYGSIPEMRLIRDSGSQLCQRNRNRPMDGVQVYRHTGEQQKVQAAYVLISANVANSRSEVVRAYETSSEGLREFTNTHVNKTAR